MSCPRERQFEIRRATTVAELTAADHLYDSPSRLEWAERFLSAPGHLMLIAYLDGVPAGLVSGIEMLHPDKGTEMCLYELAVAGPHRRQGIGRALTDALAASARERGCYDMWVGVDHGNEAALATYRASGAASDGEFSMLTWDFTRPTVTTRTSRPAKNITPKRSAGASKDVPPEE